MGNGLEKTKAENDYKHKTVCEENRHQEDDLKTKSNASIEIYKAKTDRVLGAYKLATDRGIEGYKAQTERGGLAIQQGESVEKKFYTAPAKFDRTKIKGLKIGWRDSDSSDDES